ncbi:MAG: hypothetical protein Q4A71_05060 [Actinomycetaceae bacterium]|nr:hypothetical protein [Actinomycetaceae bacterium]
MFGRKSGAQKTVDSVRDHAHDWIDAAADFVAPKVDQAAKAAKPVYDEAVKRFEDDVVPLVVDANKKVREEVIPTLEKKAQKASEEARKTALKVAANPKVQEVRAAADSALSSLMDKPVPSKKELKKATKAARKAAKKAAKSQRKGLCPCRGGKGVLCVLFAAIAGGTGYVLWRRSRPVEDPWAEEYWEDVQIDLPIDNADVKTEKAEEPGKAQ